MICRVPLDRVNRLYLGVMESVQSTLFFMGFMFFTEDGFFTGTIKNVESARSKRAVKFSTSEQQKG